jgi:HK97 family phage prohead protease
MSKTRVAPTTGQIRSLRLTGGKRSTKASAGEAVRFIASTDREARDGDVIDQSSWMLDDYRANPVVLWAHDDRILPVGKAALVDVEGGALVIDIVFDTALELGAQVARQVDEGFLSALSVRWRSAETVWRDTLPEEHPYYSERGIVYRQNELLEVSVVPVPSDAGALAQRGLPEVEPSRMTADELREWVAQQPVTVSAEAIRAALSEPDVVALIVSALMQDVEAVRVLSEGVFGATPLDPEDDDDATSWFGDDDDSDEIDW